MIRIRDVMMTRSPSFASRAFAFAILLIGSAGIAAVWVLLVYARNQHSGWMAVVAALDAAILLRLARIPAGWNRAAWGVLATALAIALANWGIAAAQIGKAMGLLPWQSLLRLGPGYAWTLIDLANQTSQIAWMLLALIVAALASR